MTKYIQIFVQFVGSAGAVLLEWIGETLGKVANLQFLELTIDQAVFVLGCVVITVAALFKMVTKSKIRQTQ